MCGYIDRVCGCVQYRLIDIWWPVERFGSEGWYIDTEGRLRGCIGGGKLRGYIERVN